MINRRIVKVFQKNYRAVSSITAKFVGVDLITYKNGSKNSKESSRTKANQIPLSGNRPKQSPSFFVFTHVQYLRPDSSGQNVESSGV